MPHNIEMYDVHSRAESPPLYDDHQEYVELDDVEVGDEGALLGSPQHPERHSPGDLWPGVRRIVLETAPTLLLTTVSLLFTGELLDHVSRWEAMKEVDQLIIIIPVILNLKGNLEMNLSARLGTAANVGELDKPTVRNDIILGNLSLLQVQATVVSFIAAGVSYILGLIVPHILTPQKNSVSPNGIHRAFTAVLHSRRPLPPIPSHGIRQSRLPELIMVASTSMSAACLSSIILGSFMCLLVVLCRRFGRDPDNIAPPIASCLGDLVTLSLLGFVSSLMIPFLHTPIPLLVGILVICGAASCIVFTWRNPHVKDLIKEGWTPLFGAMIISCGTGMVLDLFVARYDGFALLAVVISGLPGSVGSIFVSRLSTALHAAALSLQSLPISPNASAEGEKKQPTPRVVMITLMLVTLPLELIFLGVLRGLGWLHLPFLFVAFSIVFFCVCVAISLVLAQILTNFLWSKGFDPDMYAMPIHSAVMDLVGQLLLVICFEIVSRLGAHVRTNLKTPGQ